MLKGELTEKTKLSVVELKEPSTGVTLCQEPPSILHSTLVTMLEASVASPDIKGIMLVEILFVNGTNVTLGAEEEALVPVVNEYEKTLPRAVPPESVADAAIVRV